VNVFFADSANGNSILDGRHNVLFYTTSLQYDPSTRRLYSSTGAFSGYNHQFGNYLWLQRTGWTDGLYMVKQKIDSNYIELETWAGSLSYGDSGYLATIPGVLPAPTSGGIITGISTGSGPKDTIANGISLMTASAENDLHVTGTFTEKVTPNVLGSSSQPNTIWGFDSYPGDGNKAILDAATSPDHGVYLDTNAVGWVLRALDVKNATSGGIWQTANSDKILIDNVTTQNCGYGIVLATGATCVNCEVRNNTSTGITPASTPASPTVLIGCRITSNGSHGITRGCVAIGCLIAQNGGYGINNSTGAVPLVVDHSTIDADGAAYGMFLGAQPTVVTDTIIVGAATHAIRRTSDCGNLSLIRNLLLHDNAANFNNCRCDSGLVEADPLFVDADNLDYRIKVGSPAAGRGTGGGNLGFDPRHLTNLRTPFV